MKKILTLIAVICVTLFAGAKHINAQPQMTPPPISVNPAEITRELSYMQHDTINITITNNGSSQLRWNTLLNYDSKSENSEAYFASGNTLYKFNLNDPTNVTATGYSAFEYIGSPCYVDGMIYYLINAGDYRIFGLFNTITGATEIIAYGLMSGALAYNPVSGTLYGCNTISYNATLYSITPSTGRETAVANINSDIATISITFDRNGSCYILDVAGNIKPFNIETGSIGTPIYTIQGFMVNYGDSHDIPCDFETNTLYCTSVDTADYKHQLFSYNLDSGTFSYLGKFPIFCNGLATTSSIGWMNVEPVFGVVEAGESTTVAMRLNGGWAQSGTFNATCSIVNNAANAVEIPVTMTIAMEKIPGDVNLDGIVNVIDIQTAVAYICEGNPSTFDFDNADINGDGTVNILDVMLIVNIIFRFNDTSTHEEIFMKSFFEILK